MNQAETEPKIADLPIPTIAESEEWREVPSPEIESKPVKKYKKPSDEEKQAKMTAEESLIKLIRFQRKEWNSKIHSKSISR